MIGTQQDGYVISADGGLDVCRFEALMSAARAAARQGDWATSARQASAALSLWRGEALAGVESELLVLREVPRLTELRMQAVETRIEADLHLGGHTDVIAELQRLSAAHPLRERLHAMLMLAFYRDGRQSEALVAYQRARRLLIDEVGIEPGAELQEMHQAILTADVAALGGPGPAPPTEAGRDATVLRQLPAAVRNFSGRETELKALTCLLDEAARPQGPGTAVIAAIGGPAGVGKTALALHWAHQAADRFPDGQLYLDLRGYGPAGAPMTPAEAVRKCLDALGCRPASCRWTRTRRPGCTAA